MKFTRLLILLLIVYTDSIAQTDTLGKSKNSTQNNPTLPLSLPAMTLTTEQAQNNLNWYCQYDGVKSIAIQRSIDSVRNFITIGLLNAPKKGNGSYIDKHPVVGKNYYRLSVEFGGDLEWFSNTYKVVLDSATIAKAMEVKATPPPTPPVMKTVTTKTVTEKPIVSTQTPLKEEAETVAKPEVKVKKNKAIVEKKPEIKDTVVAPQVFTFIPSTKIFTDLYTGHVTIKLEDIYSHRYSIRFYDPSKNEVLRISRVSKPSLILDKNNFNSRGIYSFQLYDGSVVIDSGYVNIY